MSAREDVGSVAKPERTCFRSESFARGNAVVGGSERFCDVVMKGGVTSGVVYPLAICHLATKYILKNIGGTSVGAIAAALAAAAEYRRATDPQHPSAGYLLFSRLPDFLERPGTLLRLFAADDETQDLLGIGLSFVGSSRLASKVAFAFWAACQGYVFVPFLTAIAAVLIFKWIGWLSGLTWWQQLLIALGSLLLWLGVTALVLGARFALRMLWLRTRQFGICHGHSEEAWGKATSQLERGIATVDLPTEQVPPLMDWLYIFIQDAAGKHVDMPLTFGDLWALSDGTTDRMIDFRMMTTCLTLGRPFEIPFDSTAPPFYFEEAEFAQYFPAPVMRALKGSASPLADQQNGGRFYPFPPAPQLPVIVGTRFSMSFPVLFSAVPLYLTNGAQGMKRVWFSDGGLSSNFPIHFFDSPLPRWPTFALDLLGGEPLRKGQKPDYLTATASNTPFEPGAVFMEDTVPADELRPFDNIVDLPGFGMGIVNTARSWQDSTLGTLPGNRSRTVGIRLSGGEGGLNLNMSPDQVADLIALGDRAGQTLVSAFGPMASVSDPLTWQNHRWTRCRATLSALTRWLDGFDGAMRTVIPGQTAYDQLPQGHGAPHALWPVPPNVAADALKDIGKLGEALLRPIGSGPTPADGLYENEPTPIAVLPTRPVV